MINKLNLLICRYAANRMNGINTYLRFGSNPIKNGYNRYSNEDHMKTNFLIPFTTRYQIVITSIIDH